nr:MAG TPA: hypothetical protein [Caudoviricetes sp.]DAO13854.1 MAG TPA: hypothetical protein [Caudoviricetes sp.]
MLSLYAYICVFFTFHSSLFTLHLIGSLMRFRFANLSAVSPTDLGKNLLPL